MKIKELIQSHLRKEGITPSELARQAGVPIPSITRLLSGERKGLRSGTWEKIWPLIAPRAQPEDGKAA